jgi:hypothetical protein
MSMMMNFEKSINSASMSSQAVNLSHDQTVVRVEIRLVDEKWIV